MKKISWSTRLAIITSTILIVGGLLLGSKYYFSYLEVKNMAGECFDKGGLPTIEKSGLTITYFSCDY